MNSNPASIWKDLSQVEGRRVARFFPAESDSSYTSAYRFKWFTIKPQPHFLPRKFGQRVLKLCDSHRGL